jgi:hypothetical protein
MLVPEGTTVGELAAKIHPDLEKHFLYAESIDGMRLGEDHILTQQTSITLHLHSSLFLSSSRLIIPLISSPLHKLDTNLLWQI